MAERSVPTQKRSRERRSAILDAAAEIFAEVGFDAATTESIAARADTSIGSVYRFFPNKKAIFFAVADRLVEREEELFMRLMGEGAELKGWRELLEFVIDGWTSLQMREPASRAVWTSNLLLHSEVQAASLALHERIVRRTEALVAFYAPKLDPERRKIVAQVMVEALTGMLFASFRYDEQTSQAMIQEAKRMLILYAESVIDED